MLDFEKIEDTFFSFVSAPKGESDISIAREIFKHTENYTTEEMDYFIILLSLGLQRNTTVFSDIIKRQKNEPSL